MIRLVLTAFSSLVVGILVGAWFSISVHGEMYVGRTGSPNGPCVALERGQEVGHWESSSDGRCHLSRLIWWKMVGY